MVQDVPLLAIKVVAAAKADSFEARFGNWVRWCVQRGLYRGRAGSVEGAYRSPQHWDPPEPRPPTIDLVDALTVNRGYTRLAELAPYHAKVIKTLVFNPKGYTAKLQAQVLGSNHLKLGPLLDTAKQMLKNQLQTS
jgi:hypothetical protein